MSTREQIAEIVAAWLAAPYEPEQWQRDNASGIALHLMPLVDRLRAEAAAEALEASAEAGDTKGLDRTADYVANWLRDRAATLRAEAAS